MVAATGEEPKIVRTAPFKAVVYADDSSTVQRAKSRIKRRCLAAVYIHMHCHDLAWCQCPVECKVPLSHAMQTTGKDARAAFSPPKAAHLHHDVPGAPTTWCTYADTAR